MARLNLLLLALVIGSALALVTSRHQSRRLYNELSVELAAAKRFDEDMGRLQIEQSFWSTPSRIERVAREKLAMRVPDVERTRVLAVDVTQVAQVARSTQ
jgi:cell division protein FtsL